MNFELDIEVSAKMENVILNNGVKMPVLGFGTYLIREGFECEQSVLNALNIGYRLIDTASAYNNEDSVGRAIKKSNVKRKEIFVTTKFVPANVGYEKTKHTCEASLKRMGLDYIDLYLIHLPQGDVNSSWKAMEELYKDGKVRAIGVSNFNINQISDLVKQHNVVPAVNQVETHPFSQKIEMQNALKSYGIQLESWAPFAQGINNLFNQELLVALSNKYDKSIAHVVLRWLIHKEVVAIPKSTNINRMNENFNVFDFDLSADDLTAIKTLDKGRGLIYSV